MIGLEFVHDDHMGAGNGMYLPEASLLGFIRASLFEIIAKNRQTISFIPDILKTDCVLCVGSDLIYLAISKQKALHLPIRGTFREANFSKQIYACIEDSEIYDATGTDIERETLGGMEIHPWVSFLIRRPAHNPFLNNEWMSGVASKISNLIKHHAEKELEKEKMSKVFISYTGKNVEFVSDVKNALEIIGIRTWFAPDDLVAGSNLTRDIDTAFLECSAAVFMITADYQDNGVIAREIDNAENQSIRRSNEFKVIPLLLTQHGGLDVHIPKSLQNRIWKKVNDIQVIPTIIKSLPENVRGKIKYSP